MTQTVLLAGATGMLGQRIATHLLDSDDADLRLLVRPGWRSDPVKRSTVSAFRDRGAAVVDGDLTDPDALRPALDGADVVVSAVQGGPRVILDGQVTLAQAAAAAGVHRFLPSDYAMDLFKAPPGLNPSFDLRREADEAIAATGLDLVHVLGGAFLDLFTTSTPAVELDPDTGVARYWGTGQETFEATSIDDTARYTTHAALDPALPTGKLPVAGQQLSFDGVVAAHERATGRSWTRQPRGSVEDLRAWTEQRRAAGDEASTVLGGYQLCMLTGVTALDEPQNARYADVTPATLDDLLAAQQ